MERSATPATSSTSSSSELSHEARERATQFINQIRFEVELCLKLYMTQKELVQKLEDKGVHPWLTTQVWMIMRKENPEFFRAYDARLECIGQIKLFNFFIEQQHRMIITMMATSAPQPAVPDASIENMIRHMAANPVETYVADEWRNETAKQQPVPLQVQYSEQMQNLQYSKKIQNFQDSDHMQNLQLSKQMQNLQDSGQMQNLQYCEQMQNIQDSAQIHNLQYSEQMQNPRDFGQLQNLHYSGQIENLQYSGQMQNLQDYGQLQNLQFSEQMQNLQWDYMQLREA